MKYITGNLFESDAQAFVNTVNTVGIMGKGIALQFKELFPTNFKLYAHACKKGEVKIGKMFVVKERTLSREIIIINFPTKTVWQKKSQYDYIEEGLKDLVNVIREYNIESIAMPPVGCGNGGLDWEKIQLLLDKYLGPLSDVSIHIYRPNDTIKKILQKEEKPLRKEIMLTPARAMLLSALFRYERLGETATVFAANKLAYFLQKSGEPLRLQFVPYTYGPYAQAVEKVLYALNGKYLKGIEQMNARPFEPLELNYSRFIEVENFNKTNLSFEQKHRLENLFKVIEGFESTLSLEILASTHYLLTENPKASEEDIFEDIQKWSERKKNIITRDYIDIAINHLQNYGSTLTIA